MKNLIKSFLYNYETQAKRNQKSYKTIENYAGWLNKLDDFCDGDTLVSAINKVLQPLLDRFINNRDEAASNTGALASSIYRRFIKYFNECTEFKAKESEVIHFKTITGRRQAYTSEQMNTIFEELQNESDFFKAIFFFYLATGIRRSEIEHIDFAELVDKGEVHLLPLKNGNRRLIRLSNDSGAIQPIQWTREYIKNNLNRFNNLTAIQVSDKFSYFNKKFNDKHPEMKLNISAHYLRHCFASNLFNLVESAERVQRAMGHKNLSTTNDIYITYSDSKVRNDINRMQHYKYTGNEDDAEIIKRLLNENEKLKTNLEFCETILKSQGMETMSPLPIEKATNQKQDSWYNLKDAMHLITKNHNKYAK